VGKPEVIVYSFLRGIGEETLFGGTRKPWRGMDDETLVGREDEETLDLEWMMKPWLGKMRKPWSGMDEETLVMGWCSGHPGRGMDEET
jgi:hypothetical protein